jgi:hypothetical protein
MARIAIGSVRAGVEVTAERERVVIGDRQTPQRRMATTVSSLGPEPAAVVLADHDQEHD